MFLKKLEDNIKSIHPFIILCVFLFITLILTLLAHNAISARHEERLQQLSERIANSVASRMERYERSLVHIRAYFITHPDISRKTFSNYVNRINLHKNYPGIQGLGYTQRVKSSELKKYERKVRKEGFEDFQVWPNQSRDEYYSIHFLEPFDWRNKRAFGFDMFTQPIRAEAMKQARDKADAIRTKILTLVQETSKKKQPGFLLYLPIFSTKDVPDTLEERREQLLGFIYAPFRAHDFFSGIFKSELKTHKEVAVEIYDGININQGSLIYSNDILFKERMSENSKISRKQILESNGEKWTIVTTYRTSITLLMERLLPWGVCIFGCFLSFLIFWILYAEKKHALEIEKSLTRFNALFTNLTEGLIFANPNGDIQLMNNEALKIFQFLDTSVPTNYSDYDRHFEYLTLNGEEVSLLDRPIPRVMRGEKYLDYELEFIHIKSGKRLFLNFGGTPIKDKKGDLVLVVITVRDVTDKKKIEIELRKAISARDEFVSISSHELKTPLTSLKLKTQIFKRKFKDSTDESTKDFRTYLELADQQIMRLSRLVDDMLDISRIRAEKFSLLEEEVDFCSLVTTVLDQLKPQFAQAGYDEPILISCEKVVGFWDPLRIEQVINNLLTNAIRYGEGKPVELEIEAKQDYVRLYVRDQGAGISTEQQQRIFNRFERLTEVHESTGLGLGLFLSQQIVTAHKGRIWVESELKKGSCFIVELPLNHVSKVV